MSSEPNNKSSEGKSKTSSEKSSTKTKASDSSSSSEKTKAEKSKPPVRSTSYFSSVSTDEYRSGWDAIFSGEKQSGNASVKENINQKVYLKPPFSISLSDSDLNDEITELLIAALRKRAKKDKLPIGKYLKKSKLIWRLDCEVEE